jgi:hypothetical protein
MAATAAVAESCRPRESAATEKPGRGAYEFGREGEGSSVGGRLKSAREREIAPGAAGAASEESRNHLVGESPDRGFGRRRSSPARVVARSARLPSVRFFPPNPSHCAPAPLTRLSPSSSSFGNIEMSRTKQLLKIACLDDYQCVLRSRPEEADDDLVIADRTRPHHPRQARLETGRLVQGQGARRSSRSLPRHAA